MTRIRLDLRYDGTGYSGWQKQPQSSIKTIQGDLERALYDLTGVPIDTVGSGRTDAGVHARQQVVHFDFDGPPDQFPWVAALNARLPEQILCFECWQAPADFHALLSAQHKHYIYYIHNAELPPVFRRQFCWWQRRTLDVDALNEASEYLLGTHDFSAFQNVGTSVPSPIRSLNRAEWIQTGPQNLEFHIEGDGFLKQMVRNIVGTCVDLQLRSLPPARILEILQSCERRQAGPTAPGEGLFLNAVSYSRELDNKCRKL